MAELKALEPDSSSIPRVGLTALVRNRRGIVDEVDSFDGKDGRYHVVHVDYRDDLLPRDEYLIWEQEPYSHDWPSQLASLTSSPQPPHLLISHHHIEPAESHPLHAVGVAATAFLSRRDTMCLLHNSLTRLRVD